MTHQQKTFRGRPTAKSRLEQLFTDNDPRSDEELAVEIGCSASTVETYRRDWARSVSKQTSNLSAEIEVEILALGSEGVGVSEIVETLFEEFGIKLEPTEVRGVLNRVRHPYPKRAQITNEDLPIVTISGRLMLQMPCNPPNPRAHGSIEACSACKHQKFCRLGWAKYLLACEWPLESEILMRRSDLKDFLNGSR